MNEQTLREKFERDKRNYRLQQIRRAAGLPEDTPQRRARIRRLGNLGVVMLRRDIEIRREIERAAESLDPPKRPDDPDEDETIVVDTSDPPPKDEDEDEEDEEDEAQDDDEEQDDDETAKNEARLRRAAESPIIRQMHREAADLKARQVAEAIIAAGSKARGEPAPSFERGITEQPASRRATPEDFARVREKVASYIAPVVPKLTDTDPTSRAAAQILGAADRARQADPPLPDNPAARFMIERSRKRNEELAKYQKQKRVPA
jgi:hypothetical protein